MPAATVTVAQGANRGGGAGLRVRTGLTGTELVRERGVSAGSW